VLADTTDCDYYCYLEDDILIHDPLFFMKLKWFTLQSGELSLLMPQRYETSINRASDKLYIDAENTHAETVNIATTYFLDTPIQFMTPPMNPHSGCYFLNQQQMQFWSACSDFYVKSAEYVSPLESAATLSIKNNFTIFKPTWECAAFFEVEHSGDGYLRCSTPA
jgi:hypothetical protein